MKKFIFLLSTIITLTSCSTSIDEPTPNNNGNGNNTNTTTKIFFDGYNSNVGNTSIKWNEIYSVNIDGTNLQKLTNYSSNGTIQKWSEKPVFNIDRSKIIFQSDNQNNKNDFYSMLLDGTNITKFNNSLNSYIYNPFIAGNGKVLFEAETLISTVKYYEIYIANIDLSNPIKLTTTNDGSSFDASSNNTNTKIVYANSINGGQSQIYSMSFDGTQKTLLTSTNTSLWRKNPKYSPDGSKIIFEGSVNTNPNKHSEIFIMNSNGSGITQLTNYSSNGSVGIFTEDATFTKDGNYIYFVSDESGISQIYKMNIDGTQKTKITTSAEDKHNPIVQ